MKYVMAGVLLAVGLGILVSTNCARDELSGKVPYPEGYRNWTHVKSMAIHPGHPLYDPFGGIHHIYANEKALKGITSKGAYSDGAVFVFDLLEAKNEDSALTEGNRKILGVMFRNQRAFQATGGWGYEGFSGNSRERAVSDGGSSCHACHASREDHGYVFSEYRK